MSTTTPSSTPSSQPVKKVATKKAAVKKADEVPSSSAPPAVIPKARFPRPATPANFADRAHPNAQWLDYQLSQLSASSIKTSYSELKGITPEALKTQIMDIEACSALGKHVRTNYQNLVAQLTHFDDSLSGLNKAAEDAAFSNLNRVMQEPRYKFLRTKEDAGKMFEAEIRRSAANSGQRRTPLVSLFGRFNYMLGFLEKPEVAGTPALATCVSFLPFQMVIATNRRIGDDVIGMVITVWMRFDETNARPATHVGNLLNHAKLMALAGGAMTIPVGVLRELRDSLKMDIHAITSVYTTLKRGVDNRPAIIDACKRGLGMKPTFNLTSTRFTSFGVNATSSASVGSTYIGSFNQSLYINTIPAGFAFDPFKAEDIWWYAERSMTLEHKVVFSTLMQNADTFRCFSNAFVGHNISKDHPFISYWKTGAMDEIQELLKCYYKVDNWEAVKPNLSMGKMFKVLEHEDMGKEIDSNLFI